MVDHSDRWKAIIQAVNERAVCSLFQSFRALGAEPILIKGWSVARFYPDGESREYSDIDLAVNSHDFNRLKDEKPTLEGQPLNLDLHCGLRDRDLLSWGELFEHSYTVQVNGTPVRVLSDEDNLRMTAAHWLIDGGVYRDRLWDIYYLVENRKPDFDWHRCLEAAGPVRRSWVLTAIATARDHLGLDVSELPEAIRDFRLPRWYEKTLAREWNRGPYLRVPLWLSVSSPKVMLQQLNRRFPPNPIAATTDVEGPFDGSLRLPYQIRSFQKKVGPTLSNLARSLSVRSARRP